MSRRHIDCHQEPDPLTAEAEADQSQEPAAGSVPAAEAQEAGRPNCFQIFLCWLLLCGCMYEPSPPRPPAVADQPREEAAAAGQPATEPHEAEAGQRQPARTAFKEPSRPRAASSSPYFRRGSIYYCSSSSLSTTFSEYMDRLWGGEKELEGKEDPAASCSTHFQGRGRKMKKEAVSSSSGTFEQEEEEEEEEQEQEQEEEEEEEGSGGEAMKDQSLAKEVIDRWIASTSAYHLRQESAVRTRTKINGGSMEDVERLSYCADISSGNASAASSAQTSSNDSAFATTSSWHAWSVGDQEGDENDMGDWTTMATMEEMSRSWP